MSQTQPTISQDGIDNVFEEWPDEATNVAGNVVEKYGEPDGITPTSMQEFRDVVDGFGVGATSATPTQSTLRWISLKSRGRRRPNVGSFQGKNRSTEPTMAVTRFGSLDVTDLQMEQSYSNHSSVIVKW